MSDLNEAFDIHLFIDELIEKMGMQHEDLVKLTDLKKNMHEVLHQAIFEAAAENIEPEVIDEGMERLKDEKDPIFILMELIKTSPSAQVAMLVAIDNFEKNTMEAFETLKN